MGEEVDTEEVVSMTMKLGAAAVDVMRIVWNSFGAAGRILVMICVVGGGTFSAIAEAKGLDLKSHPTAQ